MSAALPELPEVECLARSVRALCDGATMTSARFLRADLREPIPKNAFKRAMLGEVVKRVYRRSKYLILETNAGSCIIHLGMTGNLLSRPAAKAELLHTHVVLSFTGVNGNEFHLHYVDPRRFGRIAATVGFGAETSDLLKSLGPEPLDHLDLGGYLAVESRGRRVPVKNFLMNQEVVVGVGNIYASESLFRAGVLPERHAGSIHADEWIRIGKEVIATLQEAIKAGGTTFRDYKSLKGSAGYFARELSVYGRAGEPCRKCGGAIRVTRQAGRSTFFCSNCQK